MPQGLRVLILEDEPVISMLLVDMVRELGCEIGGTFATVGHAKEFVMKHAERIDVALLDINVAGERSLGFGDLLRKFGIPVVLSTAYSKSGLEGEWRSSPRLSKPFTLEELKKALTQATGGKRAART